MSPNCLKLDTDEWLRYTYIYKRWSWECDHLWCL